MSDRTETPGELVVAEVNASSPSQRSLRQAVVALVLASAILRLVLAATMTGFVLVDDAYIHLRYGRNLVETGSFVYNQGEAVFGVTSPLYALVCAGLYALTGSQVAVAVIVVNIAAWSLAALLIARDLPRTARIPVLAALLLAPSFVDGQMLGMEASLFVLLAVAAVRDAAAGRATRSAVWYGLSLVTRPEAVLLAPWLILALIARRGSRTAFRDLTCPVFLTVLLAPAAAWAAFALGTYGSVLPQSMVAKSGWNNAHYEGVFSLASALLTVPRLTFLPFLDYFPAAFRWLLTSATFAAVGWVAWQNIWRGTLTSRTWLGFYLTYVAFYVIGKGATEASWYAVPSSVALLLAAAPFVSGAACLQRPRIVVPAIGALALVATVAVAKRAPLLASYVDGYGATADALNDLPELAPASLHRVVVGEIGVFGFRSRHAITDVGALVSPEVLPWKNADHSFVRIVRNAGASAFVISERALDLNEYPTVGAVWANSEERAWLDRCREVARNLDKRAFLIPERAAALVLPDRGAR